MSRPELPTQPDIPLSERETLPPVASAMPETDARYEQWLKLYELTQPLDPTALGEVLSLLRGLHGLNEFEVLVPLRLAQRSARRMRNFLRIGGKHFDPMKDDRDLRGEIDCEIDDAANWREMDRIKQEVKSR